MEIEEVPATAQGAPLFPLALAHIHRLTIEEIQAFTNGLENQIGQGGQGRVFRGQMHSPNPDLNGRPVAIKEYSDTSGPHEANHLSQFQHPNIIGLISVCETDDKFYLVTPYMANGDLLSRFRGLGWGEIVNVLRGVAQTRSPLIYRDLKLPTYFWTT
ncbi:hypothetical protein A4A49_06911 [Nicotiana attenuata]|uniref:Protein kinase domain-containing protein n=1 Tax=Nicotiana attenuata TaxID=49451 RepID=A0A1J6I847_NICAT|nr:hypothetical protein A4A49_06911 [Nicotiana attenuata]